MLYSGVLIGLAIMGYEPLCHAPQILQVNAWGHFLRKQLFTCTCCITDGYSQLGAWPRWLYAVSYQTCTSGIIHN